MPFPFPFPSFFLPYRRSFIELHHLHFIPFPPSQFLKRYILKLLNQLFINSIILPSLAVVWSLLLFVFPSLPALSLSFFILLTLPGLVLFSSLSPLLSSYLVLLPRSQTLRREPGRLFQCMRPDNHSAVIMSAILFFSLSLLLLFLLSAGALLMWRNALSFTVGHSSIKPQISGTIGAERQNKNTCGVKIILSIQLETEAGV